MVDVKGKTFVVMHESFTVKTAGARTRPTATKAISKDDRPSITDRQDTRPTATKAIIKDDRTIITDRQDTRPTATNAVSKDDRPSITDRQANLITISTPVSRHRSRPPPEPPPA